MTRNSSTKTDYVSESPIAAKPKREATGTSVILVGGQRILRDGIGELLESRGIEVARRLADEDGLAESLKGGGDCEYKAVVLVLSGTGAFGMLRRIHDTLDESQCAIPLVVLFEHAVRGQVYTALRIGARAYVNFDADPDELVKAIETAAGGKVYLAPDVAELLVNDISTAMEPSRHRRLPKTELTRREIEVVQLLCDGLGSKEIGRHLHISAKTAENHRYNIYRKCNVDSITALMRHAIRQGMISV